MNKQNTSLFEYIVLAAGAVAVVYIVATVALAQQRPVNVGPQQQQAVQQLFSGVPRPSASVPDQPDTTVTITVPAAFATALEKDRVDTLLPTLGSDGKTITMQPLNPDMAHHLMYLILQDGGALITVFRKYPPPAAQQSIDAANTAAKTLQDQINAARTANVPAPATQQTAPNTKKLP